MTLKTAIVTAGPTREWIDPVRYLSNASSGAMGYALAAALQQAGVQTTLVSGPVDLAPPDVATFIACESAADMEAAVQQSLPADVAVCTAAVADWRPAKKAYQKLKKELDQKAMTIELERSPDILETLGRLEVGRPSLVIGFALESENLVDNAVQKRRNKNADWIFANPVATLSSDSADLTWINQHGAHPWQEMSKQDAAQRIVQEILIATQQEAA